MRLGQRVARRVQERAEKQPRHWRHVPQCCNAHIADVAPALAQREQGRVLPQGRARKGACHLGMATARRALDEVHHCFKRCPFSVGRSATALTVLPDVCAWVRATESQAQSSDIETRAR